jgi:hypothetical protein
MSSNSTTKFRSTVHSEGCDIINNVRQFFDEEKHRQLSIIRGWINWFVD